MECIKWSKEFSKIWKEYDKNDSKLKQKMIKIII